jgi:hypothetical protein
MTDFIICLFINLILLSIINLCDIYDYTTKVIVYICADFIFIKFKRTIFNKDNKPAKFDDVKDKLYWFFKVYLCRREK